MKSKFKPTTITKQKVNNPNEVKEKSKYDPITTTQQAINMALAENRVVRFQTTKSNSEIKRTIDDLKGCALRKPDKDSHEVAVIPPSIDDFCFEEEINTKVESDSRIIIPKPRIYTPYE